MRRVIAWLVVAAAVLAPSAKAATPDTTNHNYRSSITSVDPSIPGVSLQVLDYNDELVLTNHSHHTITVFGYNNEPYARILGDGTAEVNTTSPAYYLNRNFYGNVTVPPSANASFPPHWAVVDKTGQFQWHDHRIHWMSPLPPPQVKDKAKTTKIFNWLVPIKVDNQPGAVNGNLFWVGRQNGFPTWALISLIAIVIAGIGGALVAQRRRLARGDVEPPAREAREAW